MGVRFPQSVPNMNIVTVTCTRDKFAMVLQASSINLFATKKVIHWVIIQDQLTPYEEWKELLSPYYTAHELHIIPNWINNDLNGWNQQQILKFQASKFINDENYLILDSKNFFIKKTDLSEFLLEGHRHYIDTNSLKAHFTVWYEYLELILEIPTPKTSWVPQTPFTVKTENVNKIPDIENLYIDFSKKYKNENPSEFLLYRYFSEDPKNINNYQHIVWDKTFLKKINKLDKEVICLGIHREALIGTKIDDPDIFVLTNFLKSLNFSDSIILNFISSFQQLNRP